MKHARDLAKVLTYELASHSDTIPAWGALPLGDAGRIEATIALDVDGKVVSATIDEPRAGRPEHLVTAFDRVTKILRIGPLALDGDVVRSGVLHVRISATVSDVPVPDRPGGPFGFERAYAQHRGRAAFTLETGRHVEFLIEVLATEATGR